MVEQVVEARRFLAAEAQTAAAAGSEVQLGALSTALMRSMNCGKCQLLQCHAELALAWPALGHCVQASSLLHCIRQLPACFPRKTTLPDHCPCASGPVTPLKTGCGAGHHVCRL